ncbi:sensor histidine kinase [Paenibacillus sp. FSL R10-2734]|uniref:sensor histidine kinase n=1 Tax=Paenibacillus sp. FSL R10-2734 TaxID=2954691 RepID=UPI0030D7DD1F
MKIRQMRIVQKLIVGYFLLICLPFALFGYLFYRQMIDNLLDQYLAGRQQLMEQVYGNLEIELSKIESNYSLFQNNANLTDYLNGTYEADWEMVYNYRKEIGPTFSFVLSGNPVVKEIRIFKRNESVLELPPDIMDFRAFDDPRHAEAILALPPNRGLWTYDVGKNGDLPIISYTHKLYNDSYSRDLGLLQITVNEELIDRFFQTLQTEDEVWSMVSDSNQQVVYSQRPLVWSDEEMTSILKGLRNSGVQSYYVDDHKYLLNATHVQKLGLTMMEISKVGPILDLRAKQASTIIVGLISLGVLSLFYFAVATSITSRILKLSRHMKRVDDPRLALYPGAPGTDEVGFLIMSYNKMIYRMDMLGQTVHRVELMKKEAEIKMLQAQIKPHFLYNTLETMRMMALMKNDQELAEVAFTLGNLLRYSLTKDKDESTLFDEMENVRNYIAIHKVRMGERLHFELEIHGNALDLTCPRFILQPIVENSILHGLGKIRGKGVINLTINEMPDFVIIRISDNGAGISQEKLSQIRSILDGVNSQEEISSSGGIGLLNVNERIKAFYGGSSGITIESEGGKKTIFIMRLDKRREVL